MADAEEADGSSKMCFGLVLVTLLIKRKFLPVVVFLICRANMVGYKDTDCAVK